MNRSIDEYGLIITQSGVRIIVGYYQTMISHLSLPLGYALFHIKVESWAHAATGFTIDAENCMHAQS